MTKFYNTLRETIKTANVARIFGLTNGAAINTFKKGDADTLSDITLEKMGSQMGYTLVKVMVKTDDNIIDNINECNDQFISDLNVEVQKDSNKKEAKKLEAEKLKEEKAAEKARINAEKIARGETVEETQDVPKVAPVAAHIDIDLGL